MNCWGSIVFLMAHFQRSNTNFVEYIFKFSKFSNNSFFSRNRNTYPLHHQHLDHSHHYHHLQGLQWVHLINFELSVWISPIPFNHWDVRDRTVTPLCLISYAQPLCQECIQKQNFFFNSLIEFASVVIKTPTNKTFVRERSQRMLSSLHTVHLCVHWALTPSALFALLFCYSYKISEAHYTCANAVKLNGQW